MQKTNQNQPNPLNRGTTLIELMVVVVIVGILAAISIPVLSGYIKESKLSEAVGNIQAILASEEAYLSRFQHYTLPLPYCPVALPPKGSSVIWRKNPGDCPDWETLGWRPDGSVVFRYRIATHYDGTGIDQPANQALLCAGADGGNCTDQDWAIDWVATGHTAAPILPWCTVEAEADTDGDGKVVFMRSNSVNHLVYRSPNPKRDKKITY